MTAVTELLTPANIRRWRADPARFAEDVLFVRSPSTGGLEPLRLLEHQRNFLREAARRDSAGRLVHKVAVCCWPKREGKSLCAAILVLHRLVCFEQQRCGVLANSERQAQSVIFSTVCDLVQDSPVLRGLAQEPTTRRLEIPALGNVLETYAANYRTVQGIRFDVLATDELHASEDGGKAFVFASQQTERPDAQVIISSQAGPPVDANPLWRLYQAAQKGDPAIYFDYRQELACPWSVERAEKARAELLPAEYDYLWRNLWGATGLKLFAASDVEAAAWDYGEPQSEAEWRELRQAWGFGQLSPVIAVGLDRAGVSRRGDRTVWTVVARFDLPDQAEVYRVLRCTVLPTGSEAEVIEEDRRTRAIFGSPERVLFEYYGASDIVGKVRGAELVSPTLQRQATAFTRLHRLFTEGRIAFPAAAGVDPGRGTPGLLKAELLGFEYDAEREGLTRFGTQRGHDDCVYSLAWAVEAAAAAPPRPWWYLAE